MDGWHTCNRSVVRGKSGDVCFSCLIVPPVLLFWRTLDLFFLLNPPKPLPVLGGRDHATMPFLQLWLSVTPASVAIKYICFPFGQFIELSDISGPARPQMGPVTAEMEGQLSGPSRPHQRRTGISTRLDGFRRCTGGSWRKAQRLIQADSIVSTELSFIPLEIGKLFLYLTEKACFSFGLVIN